MANGGIIGPVNDPTIEADVTTHLHHQELNITIRIWSRSSRLFSCRWWRWRRSSRWRWSWRIQNFISWRNKINSTIRIIPVTVGAGGAGTPSEVNPIAAPNGSPSIFSTSRNYIHSRWRREMD
jgi:hypothetical protein